MKKIKVTTENVGNRLDKFLSEEFFSLSRGAIIRAIRNGNIMVNGVKSKPSYVLKGGDEILYQDLNENEFLEPNYDILIDVNFECDDFIVIEKPAGISMHPTAIEKKHTVANWIIANYPEMASVHGKEKDAHLRPGIVHRLDKHTSGLVIIAKTKKSFDEFKVMFSDRLVLKTYAALVHGNIAKNKGEIRSYISRASDYKKQKSLDRKISESDREAITLYDVQKRYEKFTLIHAFPKTGRMHQIRVHFSSIGHPIAGDCKYITKQYKNEKNLPNRQLLHAKELSFNFAGNKFNFVSDLPKDFKQFLANID